MLIDFKISKKDIENMKKDMSLEEKIYLLKNSIEYASCNKDNFKIKTEKIINDFFLEIPSTQRYSYYLQRYHDFISAFKFIISSNEFEKDKNHEFRDNTGIAGDAVICR